MHSQQYQKVRDYQNEAVENAILALKNKKYRPSLIVIPTAGGKSFVIAELIRRLGDPPTLVLQPNVELLSQNYNKFKLLGGEASLYSASVNSREISNVTYATIGSIKNDFANFQHIKYVIIDEAHLGTDSQSMIVNFIKNLDPSVKVLGLTATPLKLKSYKIDGYYYSQLNILTRMRPKFWKDIIHVTQIKQLYEQKWLCPLRFTAFDFGLRKVSTSGSDYDMKKVSKLLIDKGVISFTANLIKTSIAKGKKKILVFAPTVEDCYLIKKLIPELEIISAKTPKEERKVIVNNFVNGDLKVVANYGTLTTGFDAPTIDLIIMVRPTQSYFLYYQMVGRGMRIALNKLLCDIIDLSGNYAEFGDPKDLIIEDHPIEGWCLFVNDMLISGTPFGQKIPKDGLGEKVTFGKYKGQLYKDVPPSYWQYLKANIDLTTSWAKKHIVKPLNKLGI